MLGDVKLGVNGFISRFFLVSTLFLRTALFPFCVFAELWSGWVRAGMYKNRWTRRNPISPHSLLHDIFVLRFLGTHTANELINRDGTEANRAVESGLFSRDV